MQTAYRETVSRWARLTRSEHTTRLRPWHGATIRQSSIRCCHGNTPQYLFFFFFRYHSKSPGTKHWREKQTHKHTHRHGCWTFLRWAKLSAMQTPDLKRSHVSENIKSKEQLLIMRQVCCITATRRRAQAHVCSLITATTLALFFLHFHHWFLED